MNDTMLMPKDGRTFAVDRALTAAGTQLHTRHMDTVARLGRNKTLGLHARRLLDAWTQGQCI